jgi:hypothetical protein
VSELLGRVRALFIADVGRAPVALVHEAAPQVGLICDAGAAGWASAALALRLARGGPALVCRWPAGGLGGGVPAWSGARRLARRLVARELSARAAGRLVLVDLADDPVLAVAEAGRALAAAGTVGAAGVVVVAGPRPDGCDALLADRDAIVVATPADAGPLAAAAGAGAAALGPPVIACDHRSRPAERLLALAGIAAVGELRRAFDLVAPVRA